MTFLSRRINHINLHHRDITDLSKFLDIELQYSLQLFHLPLKGTIIPSNWKSITSLKPTKNGLLESKKLSRGALELYAIIVSWFNCKQVKDKETGKITLAPKFEGDELRKNYSYFVRELDRSQEQVRRYFTELKSANLISMELRTVLYKNWRYPNTLCIKLNKEAEHLIAAKNNNAVINKLDEAELKLTTAASNQSFDEIDQKEQKTIKNSVKNNDILGKKIYALPNKKVGSTQQKSGVYIKNNYLETNNNSIRSDKNKSDFINSNISNSIHAPKTTLVNQKAGQGGSKNLFDSEADSVIALKPIAPESITLEPQSNAHITSFQDLSYLPSALKNITISSLNKTITSTLNLEYDFEHTSKKPSDIPNFTYILNNSHDATTANNHNTTTTRATKTPNLFANPANCATTKLTGDSRKPLSFFHPLSEEDAIYLRKSSGRSFNLSFINKLLLKLSEKFPKDGAYTKFQLLSKYLTARLMFEKTNPELGNLETFNFRPIEGTQEHVNRQKYKYLTAIENSLNTNPSTLIKQKIIGFSLGDSNYAYHTITNCKLPYIDSSEIKHLNITDLLKNCEANTTRQENSFNHNSTYAGAANTLSLSNNNDSSSNSNSTNLRTLEIKISNEVTEAQKSIIAKAINEVLNYSINISFKVLETAFLKPEVEITNKSTINNTDTAQKFLNQLEPLNQFESLNQPETSKPSSPLWQKIRQILSKRHGEANDISWFSKLDIEVKAADDKNSDYDNDQNNIQNNVRSSLQDNMLPSVQDSILADIRNNMQNHIQGSIQDNIRNRSSIQSIPSTSYRVIIKAPTNFMRDWIRNNYESSIEDAIKVLIDQEPKESYEQNNESLEPIYISSLHQGLKSGLSIVCAN